LPGLREAAERDTRQGDGAKGEAVTRPGEAKRAWHLLPLSMVEEVVDVFQAGAVKHSPFGWQTVPDAKTQYHDALMRHLADYERGEVSDLDDGRHPLAHLIADALILLWHENRGAPAAELLERDNRMP